MERLEGAESVEREKKAGSEVKISGAKVLIGWLMCFMRGFDWREWRRCVKIKSDEIFQTVDI